ncbi:MAG: hypothetical protein KKH72_02225, partial [Alphaproteobacteria bacterium]|nr:hypothetical protein [Alphaproteobacteria bacterium]
MAERKPGPVKPPTIDLTAREQKTDTQEPENKAAEPSAALRQPDADPMPGRAPSTAAGRRPAGTEKKPAGETASADAPPPKRGGSARFVVAGLAGTLLGGALGLAGAYGLAFFGYWPGGGADAEIAALREDIGALYVKRSEIGGIVDRSVGEVGSELSGLDTRLLALETAVPEDMTPALDALDQRVSALTTDLDALGTALETAVISGGDAAATETLNGFDAR